MLLSQSLDNSIKSSVNLFIGQGTVIITEIQGISQRPLALGDWRLVVEVKKLYRT